MNGLSQETIQRIFKPFKGMNAEHQKHLSEYNKLMQNKDKYSESYLNTSKQAIKDIMKENVAKRVQEAKKEIEAIKMELQAKEFKDPYANIKGNVITTEDKILIQLERMNNLQVFQAKLNAVQSPDELKSLYEEYHDDKDFYTLFSVELKKRLSSEQGTRYQALQNELNREPKEFKELGRITASLNLIENGDLYPAGIEENGLANVQFEKYFPDDTGNMSTAHRVAVKNAGYSA